MNNIDFSLLIQQYLPAKKTEEIKQKQKWFQKFQKKNKTENRKEEEIWKITDANRNAEREVLWAQFVSIRPNAPKMPKHSSISRKTSDIKSLVLSFGFFL